MLKGTKARQETKDKMRNSHIGLKHTEESKKKMSDIKIAYWSEHGKKKSRI